MSGILVIAEHLRGVLSAQSLEAVGLAHGLKTAIGGPLRVAVIAHHPAGFHEALALEGVDEILSIPAPDDHFDATLYQETAVQLAQQSQPRLLLAAHTVNAMGYASGAAVRLGGSFVSDAFAIDASGGRVIVTRGGYANKVQVRLDVSGHCITTVTVRGGSAKAPDPAPGAASREVLLDFSPIAPNLSRHGEYIDPPPADVDITKAEFILSVGRGIQDEKNIERFRSLAARLGATFGCSRPIADSGWLPKAHQVGLSGKVASNCKLYMALGISGAVQHLHGMKHVDTIIAVNTDRNAPIYNVATYGATVDLFEFADALEKAWD
jgi:electron transfer flavoprotein alpha subunit